MLFILEAKSEATLAIENAVAQEHLTPEHPKKKLAAASVDATNCLTESWVAVRMRKYNWN